MLKDKIKKNQLKKHKKLLSHLNKFVIQVMRLK